MNDVKKVVIIGGGFVGLNVAKKLGNHKSFEVTIIDRRNHHLFQPLLYQVAMAGLSPADIAYPIRSVMSPYRNMDVVLAEAKSIDTQRQVVVTDIREFPYDYLVLGCGSQHSYFGHNEWETYAPGLKTLSQATEIRRRVLLAFERAASEPSVQKQKQHLTFVIIGGGPTGVELAGAIGEMSRFTLTKDFKKIDTSRTRIILIEGMARILGSYHESLSKKAARDLENLGVQVWTNAMVTKIDDEGVYVGEEHIKASTVLWAAGVSPSALSANLPFAKDRAGRIITEGNCTVTGFANIFVAGDQSAHPTSDGKYLPGLAPVAIQQGRYIGDFLIHKVTKQNTEYKPFRYLDKGQMATIGRKRAVLQAFGFRLSGVIAWYAWLFVHIYYLIGFKNRALVIFQWLWSYLTFGRGARLIVDKEWRLYPKETDSKASAKTN